MEKGRESPKHESKGRRLVLFPIPLQGHMNPMLQLANILHATGFFSITIIHTHFNSPTISNYPHFTFCPIPDGLSETESEASTSDSVALLSLLNTNCVAAFRDCLAGLVLSGVEDEAKEPTACLITDAIWHFSQSVADSLEIPRIVLRTSSLSSFLAFAALPLLLEKGYLPKQACEEANKDCSNQDTKCQHKLLFSDSQLESPVLELPPLKVKDLPTISTRNHEVFYKLIGSMVKETKASSGIIWNSMEDLEQSTLATVRQVFPVPSFPIGPFHNYFPASSSSLLAQDKSSISWLDTRPPKSVLYVSFGSIASMDEAEFLEMAWGLANSAQPFLWVVRPGLVRGSKWLEPLPSGFMETNGGRGYIVKWAPQQEVLAHPATGGFWTHNGWNSTLESICEGVPMICSPCFGDQMVNARYVSHVWRIGLQFESGMERGVVEKAIRRLMVEKEGEEERERILCLKEKVGFCLKQGGSSHHYLESLISYILSF
ncbi:unnamed protein product [Camellia sinensis]